MPADATTSHATTSAVGFKPATAEKIEAAAKGKSWSGF
jgi:hypothetical protein